MRVAFIGLGGMGSRMAGRLLQAGHELQVWNRSPERTGPLAQAGAVVAQTPADAAGGAEAVMTMLSDEAALADVVGGPGGLGAGLQPGQVLIEMSTVGPSAITRLRQGVPAGVELLDAPVLGSLSEAEGGTLRVFVGGAPETLTRVRPLFDVLGEPVHVGDLGSGAAVKLVANSTLVGTLALLGETLELAQALGVDREAVWKVLAATPLAAQAERRRPVVEGDEPPRRFSLGLAVKDAGLIVGEGGDSGARLPLLEAAADWFRRAESAGLADDDYSAVLPYIVDHARRAGS